MPKKKCPEGKKWSRKEQTCVFKRSPIKISRKKAKEKEEAGKRITGYGQAKDVGKDVSYRLSKSGDIKGKGRKIKG